MVGNALIWLSTKSIRRWEEVRPNKPHISNYIRLEVLEDVVEAKYESCGECSWLCPLAKESAFMQKWNIHPMEDSVSTFSVGANASQKKSPLRIWVPDEILQSLVTFAERSSPNNDLAPTWKLYQLYRVAIKVTRFNVSLLLFPERCTDAWSHYIIPLH